jgi:predicted negative regulator of RcsB-dependent stress response
MSVVVNAVKSFYEKYGDWIFPILTVVVIASLAYAYWRVRRKK